MRMLNPRLQNLRMINLTAPFAMSALHMKPLHRFADATISSASHASINGRKLRTRAHFAMENSQRSFEDQTPYPKVKHTVGTRGRGR